LNNPILQAQRGLLYAQTPTTDEISGLDVIKSADCVIDLGPEGGDAGGYVVATGTPEEIAATPGSYTGLHLAPVLAAARERADLAR